jgi:hypothetical protein
MITFVFIIISNLEDMKKIENRKGDFLFAVEDICIIFIWFGITINYLDI